MFRRFIIDKIVPESSTIKSFYLRGMDNQALDDYLPGQFVTLRVYPNETSQEFTRNYTLSDRPGQDYLRLTVKRENQGVVSQYMHNRRQEGDSVELSQPMGNFHLTVGHSRPVVLLSGGVGITPMLSMLEHLTVHEHDRKVFFLHTSRNKAVQPMLYRLRALTTKHENLYLSVHHSEPTDDERESIDYDFAGLISEDYLRSVLPSVEMDYFLCGPQSFMEAMYRYLQQLGVDEQSIRYEFFGEGRKLGQPIDSATDAGGFGVKFVRSNIEVSWDGSLATLLDLAELTGLAPDASCRMGTCATCETILKTGSVEYNPEPFIETSPGKVLICCSQPMSDIALDL